MDLAGRYLVEEKTPRWGLKVDPCVRVLNDKRVGRPLGFWLCSTREAGREVASAGAGAGAGPVRSKGVVGARFGARVETSGIRWSHRVHLALFLSLGQVREREATICIGSLHDVWGRGVFVMAAHWFLGGPVSCGVVLRLADITHHAMRGFVVRPCWFPRPGGGAMVFWARFCCTSSWI